MRDQSAVFSKYKSEFENNIKKIQDPAQSKTSQGAPFSMSDIILKKGIDSTFRMGRGRANFGKVVPISQDVDATLTSVKRATGSIGGVLQVDVDTVEKLQDLLTRVPSGEPFANMEDLIVTQADVYHFMAVKNLVLDILRGQATATRLGGLGGALKTAAGDIARAAGGEQ